MPHDPDAPETPPSPAPADKMNLSKQGWIQSPPQLSHWHFVLSGINVILAFILGRQAEWQKLFFFPTFFITSLLIVEAILLYEQFIGDIAKKLPKRHVYEISIAILLIIFGGQLALLSQPCDPTHAICPRPFEVTPTPTPSPEPTPTFTFTPTSTPTPEPTYTPTPMSTPTPTPYTATVIMTLADAAGQPIPPYTDGSYFTPHLMCGNANYTYEELADVGAMHFYQISSTSILRAIDVEVIGKGTANSPQHFLIRTKRPTSVFKLDNIPNSSDSCYFWLIQTAGFGLLNLAGSEIERLEPYDCRDLMGRDFCP